MLLPFQGVYTNNLAMSQGVSLCYGLLAFQTVYTYKSYNLKNIGLS